MKMLAIYTVVLCFSVFACKPRSAISTMPAAPSPQRVDISPLVPAELSFAKDFVQFLSDSGWSIQGVHRSKHESFFRETNKAAYLETDHGILEVVFFDTNAAVEQIQIIEEPSTSPGHSYLIKSTATTQRTGGFGPTYFTKYRNMFIITIDRDLNDKLQKILK